MNKPNRKFSPKPTGGERSERPRRPRTNNDENRTGGFSEKRYSPILDPDDKKEWQQRDEDGRRYRPAGGEGEGPRRPHRGDGPRGDGPRGDGPRGPRPGGPRREAPRSTEYRSDFRKDEGFDGERRTRPTNSGDSPRYGNKRGGENRYGDRSESSPRPGGFRRGGDDAEKGGFNRRPNRDDQPQSRFNDQDSDGGFRTSRSGTSRSGFNRDQDGFNTPRYGNKPGGNRSEGYGNSRGEERRGDDRRGDDRRGGEGRRNDERSGGYRSEGPRAGSRGESRFGNDARGNTGRRGESRFNSSNESEGRTGRSKREGDDFEGRNQGSFKKKTFSERKVSSTSTPPTYDFSKIRSKGPKVAHTDAVIRLNKYIADAGICSRRDADELIAKGQIKVNGEVITQMGHKVSRADTVTYNGRKINPEKLVYVLLNKPKDFITTTEDPHERKTVMQLVNDAAEQRIYPVGRLDRNTTGLLLLTNDGELAEKLSHPSHKVKKVYQVLLDKPLTEEDFDKVEKGVVLEDGPAPVDEISYVIEEKTVVGVEIHIGRNRIVRRIFESLGYEVLGLDRVIYAGLTKKDLPRGHWRYLDEREVIRLKHFS